MVSMARRRVGVAFAGVLALVELAAACTQDTPSTQKGCADAPPPATACEAPVEARSAQDAVGVIATLANAVETTTEAVLFDTSRDVHFGETLELGVGDLAGIPGCPTSDETAPCAWFYAERTFHTPTDWGNWQPGRFYPPGVTCAEQGAPSVVPCLRVRIEAGTTLRFQRVHRVNVHRRQVDDEIRLVRACAAPCGRDERRCEASRTCVEAGTAYCLLCERASLQACVCRTACGVAAEGTECKYFRSDDLVGGGRCSSLGECD